MTTSWLKLAHKTCIVTGAGSGIGAAVVKVLATERCRVVLADRNLDAMEEVVAKSIVDVSGRAFPPASYRVVTCDVTDASQVQDLVKKADEFAIESAHDLDSIHEDISSVIDQPATLLVNCAGITRDKWISRMDLNDWDDVIDVNLRATYLTCRYFLDQDRMERFFAKDKITSTSHGGDVDTSTDLSIVNVGSIVSELGNLGQVNYAASKGGVLGLTRALAKEVASRNVRVNAVVPGFIDTPMAQAVPDHIKEMVKKRIPLRRFGRPDEVADLVSFLLSPRSSYITGESVAISGMISL